MTNRARRRRGRTCHRRDGVTLPLLVGFENLIRLALLLLRRALDFYRRNAYWRNIDWRKLHCRHFHCWNFDYRNFDCRSFDYREFDGRKQRIAGARAFLRWNMVGGRAVRDRTVGGISLNTYQKFPALGAAVAGGAGEVLVAPANSQL